MKLALQAAGFAALLMVTFCLWQTQRLILQFQESVVRLETTGAVTIESENLSTLDTQKQLRKTLAAVEKTTTTLPTIIDERLATTAQALDRRVEATVTTFDGRLGSVIALSNVQLGAFNSNFAAAVGQSNAQLTSINASLTRVIDTAALTITNFNRQFMECAPIDPATGKPRGNPGCLHSAEMALLKETERTEDNIRRLTDTAAKAAGKYTAPKTKKQKTLGVFEDLWWAALAAWSHGVL